MEHINTPTLSSIRYLDKVVHAIENGLPLLLENLPQDIDAVLDPVIQKVSRFDYRRKVNVPLR